MIDTATKAVITTYPAVAAGPGGSYVVDLAIVALIAAHFVYIV
ncbi:hypothetical protein [Mycolicibacterium elephantis]|uniref:Uncharacterized protein n=1 Tax=Mycolicibacterium elephantis DSM 44368 TaxID=1335622 RepID=A0A439DV14_9MYCO|nr:hypothetical protein [Mycolicibacterium elephantis]RWA20867.1 hypothetical protein MELE44368_02640 [Mycolicibacterium elephantis DSM 44368]